MLAVLALGGCGVTSVSDVDTASLAADPQGSSSATALAGPKPAASAASPGEARKTAEPASVAGARKSIDSASIVEVRKSAEKLTAVASPESSAYRIGPLDVLDVSVFKVPELSKTAQVSEVGTINYPLVGEVRAAGLTAREVEVNLTRTLGEKYLQKPQVTVFVKEYNSQRVTIEGAVKKPGVYPIQGGLTLLQLMAVAQGTDTASDDTVLIFRQENGKRSAARFTLSELRSGGASDPALRAGDVVVANSSALKEGFNNVLKAIPLAGVFALL